MNITVYLGSSEGKNPRFMALAHELGAWIGKNGHTLIYGGSKAGLMGVLAHGALEQHGRVIGVEPRLFIEKAAQEEKLTELIVTEDMTQRKLKLQELGDVFLAFPGGVGTLEEISQVLCWNRLGLLPKPFAFLNYENYYAPLRTFLTQTMPAQGFVEKDWTTAIPFLNNIEETAAFITACQNR